MPSPTSDYDVLLSKIPSAVQSQGSCPNTGTQYGAIAVAECSRLTGLGAGTIFYYLFPARPRSPAGVSSFLSGVHFHKQRECTTGTDFTDFLTECQSDFNNKTPFMTGSIAEYTSTGNDPIIVTTDRQQNVMVSYGRDQRRRPAVVLEAAELDRGLAGRPGARPSRSR